MTDLKTQEQLRDNIAGILELSRASWKTKPEKQSRSYESDEFFPRSVIFRTIGRHPLLIAAALGSVWYLGATRFGAMAVAGGSLLMRHHLSILPVAQKILSANFFKSAAEINSR